MSYDIQKAKAEPTAGAAERIEEPGPEIALGTWYWVADEEEGKPPWLGCITKTGSNFVELDGPMGAEQRIHFEEFDEWLTLEPNPQAHIDGRTAHYRERVGALLEEVRRLTARLGVAKNLGIAQRDEAAADKFALATLSNAPDPKNYKASLIKAKEETLPALFRQIRDANENLAAWMKAEMLPLKAMAEDMQDAVGLVEDRIFNVSLYAGLTEEVKLVRKGKPAGPGEKLHLMQRRAYMDEECLLNYKTGGMEFKNIGAFDRWIGKRENMDRILPFPRCMVAMRVRRNVKDRSEEYLGHPASSFIRFQLAQQDEATFLYIRNGKRLYRMDCDLDFGAYIFPNVDDEFRTGQPMMVKRNRWDPSMWLTRDDYEVRLERQAERERKRKAWKKANPFKAWKAAQQAKHGKAREGWPWWHDDYERANPHHHDIIDSEEWEPFDPTNVYYDECMKELTDRAKHYNRIALIIQGLYDRSEVLHPHPPVQTWTPEGFAAAIELVYDGANTLYDGDPPDFRDYVRRCNESMGPDSVLMGQELAWERREAVKENARRSRSWHCRDMGTVKTYRPFGDPGPGFLATPFRWQPRARKATFVWGRERKSPNWGLGQSYDDRLRTTVVVPADEMFNVSAYKPGDYLQFFRDPRTRARYLKWAPILLAAEEYHAGNLAARGRWEGE